MKPVKLVGILILFFGLSGLLFGGIEQLIESLLACAGVGVLLVFIWFISPVSSQTTRRQTRKDHWGGHGNNVPPQNNDNAF